MMVEGDQRMTEESVDVDKRVGADAESSEEEARN